MRVLLAVHGYPPELRGGTEGATQALARACAARGHEILVVAGSLDHGPEFRISEQEDRDPSTGARIRVSRLHRSDLYFDHWQKLHSPQVGEAFSILLREWRPDVVHVMHWLRLSDDLVLRAARAGVPALVSLGDHLTSCLLSLRVHPERRGPCTELQSTGVCLSCAGALAPRTPWVPLEQQMILFGERRAGLERELKLARQRIVPSLAHGEALARATGRTLGALVIPPARAIRLTPPARKGDSWEASAAALRLGQWSGGGVIKGADLILRALCSVVRAGVPRPIELHLAGGQPLDLAVFDLPPGLTCIQHGPFAPEDLGQHPVAQVHAAVVGSLAPESYGLVADEAFELGLPMLLPGTPAFLERFGDEAGVEFYEQGEQLDLARALARLCSDVPAPCLDRVPLGPDLVDITNLHLDLWRRACEGPAPAGLPEQNWFESRVRTAAQASWDRQCSQTSAAELGLGGG